MTTRRSVIAVVVGIILAIGIIGTGSARANTTQQQYLTITPQWCATTTGNSPYAPIVLGACNNNAGSQKFYMRTDGNYFEIVNLVNNLCDTYNAPNGTPDGTPIIEGNCADAPTQLWGSYNGGFGGRTYYLPYRSDNVGRTIAFDDANDVLRPYNRIDGSFFAPGFNSEIWSFFG